jgi:hypothetical protein
MSTMKTKRKRAVAALALAGGALVLAPGAGCGSKSGLPLYDTPPGPDASNDAPWQEPLECGTFSVKAELAALDVFITMDSSGSMADLTTSGQVKFNAVRNALKEFLSDPKSAGIGATIAFFPILRVDVPELCTTDVACGEPGACEALNVCWPSGESFCSTAAECPSGETCEPLGFCNGIPNEMCIVDQVPCASGAPCIQGGWCENHIQCDPAAYAPESEPAVLPQGAPDLIAALDFQGTEGGTPTLPALQASVQAAIARSQSLPDHKAIVLLATDGFPTACDPAISSPSQQTSEGIAKVVQAAAIGAESGVQTFVIGVFSPEEAALAETHLNSIADAGGTGKAYVIKTNEPVTQEFLATLNAIREAAADCDYALPKPGGALLEAHRISVRLVGPQGALWLDRHDSLEACDPVSGGYVFDKPASGPEPPTRVQLCPATCLLVRSDPAIEIEVLADCDRDAAVR